MVEMRVRGLAVDAGSRQPVVILMDPSETRFLPIWIGVFEADAILLALEEIAVPRPATHDLMKSLVGALDASLLKVVIHSLDDKTSTYFANLVVRRNDGVVREIDARPSDSIALALRLGAPIFVAEDVLVRSAVQDKAKINREMEEFKKFLAEVKPEDFARYDREHSVKPDQDDEDEGPEQPGKSSSA
jgi:bifunctional DNase/RNase